MAAVGPCGMGVASAQAAVVRESEAVAAMRRELGRQLAARRKAAGYLQRELGARVGYSRTAIANAETGGTRTGRQLWERVDQVLESGELFARGHDRIQAQIAAVSRAGAARLMFAAEPQEAPHMPDGLESLTASQARQAYLVQGWPAEEEAGGRLWLVAGRSRARESTMSGDHEWWRVRRIWPQPA